MGIIQRFVRISQDDIKSLVGNTSNKLVEDKLKHSIENFDIDKSWEIIHFLVTGNKAYYGDHHFAQIINPKSQTIDVSEDENEFYWNEANNSDPIAMAKWTKIDRKIKAQLSYLKLHVIEDLYQIMSGMNFNEIVNQTDFDMLNEQGIYPENWSNTKDHKQYVIQHYCNLKSFLDRAIKDKHYIVVC